MHRKRRAGSARTLAGSAIGALTSLALVGSGFTAPADAAPSNSYTYAAATWLNDQLTAGGGASSYGGFDGGLSLDIYFAFHALGIRPAAQEGILAAHKDDITTPPAFPYLGGTDRYAGPYGKLASAVQLAAGDDAQAFAGKNLIAEIEDLVDTDGDDAGRVKDDSVWGDNSNAIGQSFDARALANAGSTLADEVGAYLLKQQCANGAFRQSMADAQCTTGGDLDATTLVLLNLVNSTGDAIAGKRSAITRATRYVVQQQRVNGAFVSTGVATATSTGLAAAALAAVGRAGAAANSAAWLLGLQVRDAAADQTKLAGELGAIAYSQADLAAGYRDGRGDDEANENKWTRSTSQAVLGLNALAPAKRLVLRAPNAKQKVGTRVLVTGGGLLAGERWALTMRGRKVGTGLANATGGFKVKVTVPKRKSGVATLRVTGSRDVRSGTDALKIKR